MDNDDQGWFILILQWIFQRQKDLINGALNQGDMG